MILLAGRRCPLCFAGLGIRCAFSGIWAKSSRRATTCYHGYHNLLGITHPYKAPTTSNFTMPPRADVTNPQGTSPTNAFNGYNSSSSSSNGVIRNGQSDEEEKEEEFTTYRGEIFCNRALNMRKIEAVGFDMDYTLAMYKSEEFESLSCQGAIRKLVNVLNYPEELLKVEYDHSFFIRGLVIDKKRGNVLKLDRHKYVKHALHGFRELNRNERSLMYDSMTAGGGGFQEPSFACLDTIFSIPDAFLFTILVQYKDEHPDRLKHKSYLQLYADVRKSVDLCHRDGFIKNQVAKYPAKYIETDPHLVEALARIKGSGRKVFLLTNSLWNYTDVVMKFLYKTSGGIEKNWLDLFDLIITGSNKPAFIVNKQLSLYRCDTKTGLLLNTEGPVNSSVEEYLAEGKTFQGGNWLHLHKLLNVSDGTKILYVGDHIYSDVVRSKRTLGWRTMLVIPELRHQIDVMLEPETKHLAAEIQELKFEREGLEERVDRYEVELVSTPDATSHDQRLEVMKKLQKAKEALQAKRVEIAEMTDKLSARYHPVWGQLFKTGLQNSRFAEQVEDYACLYTSRVSNIRLVSPEMHWRTMPDVMPHDRLHQSPMRRILKLRESVT